MSGAKRRAEVPRAAPLHGHRCQGPRYTVAVLCECGWETSLHDPRDNGRPAAYAEWRRHVAKHAAERAITDDQRSLASEKRHVLEAVASGKCFVAMSHSLMDLGDAGLLVLDHKGPQA